MQKAISKLLFLICLTASTLSANSLEEFDKTVIELKGQVIYVDFWASWCVPCRKSFPWMNELQTKYRSKGFTILSINVDKDKELATKFLKEIEANFLIHYDSEGLIAKKFKLKGMPSSFIIDRQGKIISSHVGFTESKKLKYEKEIVQLLNG